MLIVTDKGITRFRNYKKWGLGRLWEAGRELSVLLDCPMPRITNDPIRYRELTGVDVRGFLGYTCWTPPTIYVSTVRHINSDGKFPTDFFGILVHEFVHLAWPNMYHSEQFNNYVERIYNGDIPTEG